jgi:hypothetical protein
MGNIQNEKLSKRGKGTLMLVEDPDDTLKVLCYFGDSDITKEAFTLEYEKIKGRFKPIHKKHSDTHFYSLTTFKFLIKSSEGIYFSSLISKELCNLRNDPNKKVEYQTIISRMLLNNKKKGRLFKKFLNFIREKKTQKEINQYFGEKKEFTVRALIAWSKYAGLVVESEGYYQSIPEKATHVSEDDFKNNLIAIYDSLQDPNYIGVKRIAVPIGEIRFNMGVKLGLTESEFDERLRSLLDKDNSHFIRLHGATSEAFEKEPFFQYKNKLYIYLSMKDY